jgi:extradiol dioxygenase family protein
MMRTRHPAGSLVNGRRPIQAGGATLSSRRQTDVAAPHRGVGIGTAQEDQMVTDTVQIAGYSHIGINVRNLEAAEAFYGDTMGFEKLPRPSSIDNIIGSWWRVGNMQLHLLQHEQVPNVDKGIGPHFALHIPHDAFQSTIGALRAKGAEVYMTTTSRLRSSRTRTAIRLS